MLFIDIWKHGSKGISKIFLVKLKVDSLGSSTKKKKKKTSLGSLSCLSGDFFRFFATSTALFLAVTNINMSYWPLSNLENSENSWSLPI